MIRSLLRMTALCFLLCSSAASTAAENDYDPLQLFAPLPLPHAANAYRGGAGLPGPLFWQNRADYDLHATIDPASHRLDGEETITYSNHSPDALDVLWLQLDQNIYRADSRAASSRAPRGEPHATQGIEIRSVEVEVDGRRQPAPFLVDDTRMRVALPQPLAGGGHSLRLHVSFGYDIPGPWGGRTAVTPSRAGRRTPPCADTTARSRRSRRCGWA